MPKKSNNMRYIKFMSNYIKALIPILTFTITKEETNSRSNSRSRGKLATFYTRTKNEVNTITNLRKE